jgi:hypothetical protein
MNWTKVSAISEMLSSIAVLATLIYLTIGIKQNTEILQANMRQAVMATDVQIIWAAVTDPDIWLCQMKEHLTDDEKIKLHAYLIAFMRDREFVWRQYRAGALDQETWISYQQGIVGNLSQRQSRKWWEAFSKQGAFPRAFVTFIDGLLANAPIAAQQDALVIFD